MRLLVAQEVVDRDLTPNRGANPIELREPQVFPAQPKDDGRAAPCPSAEKVSGVWRHRRPRRRLPRVRRNRMLDIWTMYGDNQEKKGDD